MRPAPRHLALLLTLLAVGSAGGAGAADEPAEAGWRVERVDRAEKLAAGATVTVENRRGDLRVRVGEPGELALHGVAQHAEGEPALRIECVAADGGWTVRVIEPEGAAPAADPRRRLDLSVAVPADAPLVLRAADGLIEARGFRAALRAETAAGEIRLRGSGAVELRSERGAVHVAFHPEAPRAPSRIETLTGAIEVELPPGADADALLETRGLLTTDFSLAVERVGPLAKRGTARIGRGGPRLELISRTGDLRLLERLATQAAPVP